MTELSLEEYKTLIEKEEWQLILCGDCNAKIGYGRNNATIQEDRCIVCYLETKGIELE